MTVLAQDAFTRSVSGGWGTATSGQGWEFATADWSVSSNAGRAAHGSQNTTLINTLPVTAADCRVRASVWLGVVPNGASWEAEVVARYENASNHYRAGILWETNGNVRLWIRKVVGGTTTTLVGPEVIGTNTGSEVFVIDFKVSGNTLSARAYRSDDPEPNWIQTVTDNSLTTANRVGIRSRRNGASNGTQTSWDNFLVSVPSITASEQDVWPPRVLVSVVDLPVWDSVQLFRVVGGERVPVRAGSSDAVTDSSFLRVDAELPFGVPVSYLAIVNDSAEYSTSPVTYTLDGGKPVVTDAINGLAVPVTVVDSGQRTYERRASVFEVGGRNVIVAGDLGMFKGEVEVKTDTTSERDDLISLIKEATEGVVQIRQPGGYNGIDAYLGILGFHERRVSPRSGTDERRIFTLNVAEAETWAPALEARGFTYEDLEAAYDGLTYADLASDYTTYLDLAQGDFS